MDAMGISAELNNTRGANLVMMGAMIAATQMMDKNSSSLIRLRITLTTRAYPVRRTCSVLKQDMRKQGEIHDL